MNKHKAIVVVILAALLSACVSTTVQPTPTIVVPSQTAASTETPLSTEIVVPAMTDTPLSNTVSFANDVLPILNSRCINCHGGEDTKKGLSFASYETLMAGSEDGPVIVPGNAEDSLLVQLVSAGKMPKRGPQLTPQQLQIIIDWITAGALNN